MRDLVFGIEGLALLRTLFEDDPAGADARMSEIRRFAPDLDGEALALGIAIPERSVDDGYAEWHATYDVMPNGLIEVEQPCVEAILDHLPAGRALDASCGTGRITALLVARGHEATGVDGSGAMLDVARAKVPDATFQSADLARLPFDDGEFDLVTCALAIAHWPAIEPFISELARVTKPGGRLLLTDIHPFAIVLAGQALFMNGDGQFAFVRNYFHPHGEYIAAFGAAGLSVLRCLEPAQNAATVATFPSFGLAPEATRQAMEGLPLALVWELERT